MPGLLSLPNELLQHIACFSTCSSVLNLLHVNHRLRNVCNDRLVYQSIARRDLNYLPGAIQKARSPCPESESILASGSLEELARLAFAAEKGIETSIAKDDTWTLKMSKRSENLDLTNWLPQMLVLKHSASIQMSPEAFLEVQGRLQPQDEQSPDKPDFCNVNFIISYLLLNKIAYCIEASEIKERLDNFFSENRSTDPPTTSENEHTTDEDSIDYLRQRVPNYGKPGYQLSINQATALLPVLILELATCHLLPGELDWLPSPSKIPFSSMLDMPALFQHHADRPFSKCHIAKMATEDFLKGNWVGFYSDQRAASSVRLYDSPMRDIRIVTRASSNMVIGYERVAVFIDQATRGVDAHGEFSLQGYITEGGRVELTKRYLAAGWSWSWMGRLTPFGMLGVWKGGYDYFGGYFWIWKQDWCER